MSQRHHGFTREAPKNTEQVPSSQRKPPTESTSKTSARNIPKYPIKHFNQKPELNKSLHDTSLDVMSIDLNDKSISNINAIYKGDQKGSLKQKDYVYKSSERKIPVFTALNMGLQKKDTQIKEVSLPNKANKSPNSSRNVMPVGKINLTESANSQQKVFTNLFKVPGTSIKQQDVAESRLSVAMKFTNLNITALPRGVKTTKDITVPNTERGSVRDNKGLNLPLNKRGSGSKESSLSRQAVQGNGLKNVPKTEQIKSISKDKECMMSVFQDISTLEQHHSTPDTYNLAQKQPGKSAEAKTNSPPVLHARDAKTNVPLSDKNITNGKIISKILVSHSKSSSSKNESLFTKPIFSGKNQKIEFEMPYQNSRSPSRDTSGPKKITESQIAQKPQDIAAFIQYNLRAKSPQFDALNAQRFFSTKNLLEKISKTDLISDSNSSKLESAPNRSSLPFIVTPDQTEFYKIYQVPQDPSEEIYSPTFRPHDNDIIDIKTQNPSLLNFNIIPTSGFLSNKNSGDENSFSKDEISDVKNNPPIAKQKFFSNSQEDEKKLLSDNTQPNDKNQDDTVQMPLVPSKFQNHPVLYSRRNISRNSSQECSKRDLEVVIEKSNQPKDRDFGSKDDQFITGENKNTDLEKGHLCADDEPEFIIKNKSSSRPEVFHSFSEMKKMEMSSIKEPLSPDISSISVSVNQDHRHTLIKSIESNTFRLPPFEPAKVVVRRHEPFDAFAINTHKGTVRNYNEDRVSVLLNGQKKFKNRAKGLNEQQKINSCAMFSIFDGHGGSSCCNFLKDKLHDTLVEELDIDGLFIPSVKKIFKRLDLEHLSTTPMKNNNFSGSCSITIIFINNTGFVVNVGDSRCIMSRNKGKEVIELTSDHKPDKIAEFNRIIENGGELYKMSSNLKTLENQYHFVKNFQELKRINELEKHSKELIFGPWRISPGGLSVSRTFGDKESKTSTFGGSEGIVVPDPDVFDFDLDEADFILLGCKLKSRWSF
jgi:serine/threonine protein phosphatase PrpC